MLKLTEALEILEEEKKYYVTYPVRILNKNFEKEWTYDDGEIELIIKGRGKKGQYKFNMEVIDKKTGKVIKKEVMPIEDRQLYIAFLNTVANVRVNGKAPDTFLLREIIYSMNDFFKDITRKEERKREMTPEEIATSRYYEEKIRRKDPFTGD